MGTEQERLRKAMARISEDADAETAKHLIEYLGYYLGEGCEEQLPGVVNEVGQRIWDFYRYLRTCGLVIRELTCGDPVLQQSYAAVVGPHIIPPGTGSDAQQYDGQADG